MNVTKSNHYLFTRVICTNKFQLIYVSDWVSLTNKDSTAIYSTKNVSNSKAYSYPITVDVFCTKKPVNEPKLYTFKQFALKIDWNKREFVDKDKNEEKEALLDLYETLKSSLAAHSERYHTRELERFGRSSKEVITGTERPFNECPFEDKYVGKAFDRLCDVMETNLIDGSF